MRILRLLLSALFVALCLGACQPRWEDTQSEFWGDDAVFYQIFVRSFADSDGDGTGDFNGITAHLDYLNDGNPKTDTDLGVTGIWLMPIFASPSYHGYDVTDYFSINPQYGTLEEFKTFLDEAHRRGIRVILDYVINHTATGHPWFRASVAGEALYRDYYIWSDTDPGYVGPWNEDVWHRSGDDYYYGVFGKEMPDLNFNNPAVTAEVEKLTNYWLKEVGVDGFRIDGAKHLIEEQQDQENTPATHAWLKDFHATYKSINPNALVVGEVWSSADATAEYVNNGELDLAFNFTLAEDILAGVSARDSRRIANSLATSERVFDPGSYAPFLSNHDQVRTMTRLNDDLAKAKSAATILLTSPGTPFIYYGEEIGMTGTKPDPSLRTPMQWTDGENAGFTTGSPWSAVKLDFALKNVGVQTGDPGSLLSHYRNLIRVRAQHAALRSGSYVQVVTNPSSLFAMLRVNEQEAVLVLVNLSDQPAVNPTLSWSRSNITDTRKPNLLFGNGNAAGLTTGELGGVENFIPLAEIGPGESVIIQYR